MLRLGHVNGLVYSVAIWAAPGPAPKCMDCQNSMLPFFALQAASQATQRLQQPRYFGYVIKLYQLQ